MLFEKKDLIPKRCVFEATLACNLRCRHCGSRAGKARPDELSTEEVRDLFVQLAALGCERVTIAGGEPMARPDWPEVIEAATSRGITAGLLTNGISFDDDAAAVAKERGLSAVGFSIDGLPAAHDRIRGKVGHFNRLMQAAASARKVGLPLSVVSFVNSLNIGRLREMHDLIAGIGAFAWQIQIGTDMGNLSDHPELMIRPHQLAGMQAEIADIIQHRKLRVDVADSIGYYGPHERVMRTSVGGKPFRGCHAGVRVIGIESNGNVKGCLSIMAGYNEKGKDFVEGNIREESLEEIWFKPGAFAYNREWTLDDLEGFCKTCKHVMACRGGCRGKMVASGNGVENTMCVHRVACEEAPSRRAAQAAAVALASVLGGGAAACTDRDLEKEDAGDAATTDEETDTGQDTGDVGAYGMPLDTATETETDTGGGQETAMPPYGMPDTALVPYGMPEYGMPDTGVDVYGMPVGSETESDEDLATETETDALDTMVTKYGMPDTEQETATPPYGMPEDTEVIVPPYGMPEDTEAVDVYAMPLYGMQEE